MFSLITAKIADGFLKLLQTMLTFKDCLFTGKSSSWYTKKPLYLELFKKELLFQTNCHHTLCIIGTEKISFHSFIHSVLLFVLVSCIRNNSAFSLKGENCYDMNYLWCHVLGTAGPLGAKDHSPTKGTKVCP